MEGGGFRVATPGLELGNIGDYKNVDDLGTIGIATLFVLFLTLVLARTVNLGGVSVNTFFDTFGLEGLVSNTMLVLLLFQFARFVYTSFHSTYGKSWSPFIFVCALISVQLLHDILFYYGAIHLLPAGKNEMIDALKLYAKEHAGRAMGGHAVFMALTAFVAMILKDLADLPKVLIVAAVLYAIPFSLSIVWRRAPVAAAAPPPAVKKGDEGMRDFRRF